MSVNNFKVPARDRNKEKSKIDSYGKKGSAEVWNEQVKQFNEQRKKEQGV